MAATAPIGLDIGSMSIRAVETGRGKDGPVVTKFGQTPLPQGAVRGGIVQDDKAVTLALKQLWSSTKFRSRKVVLGVTNPQVVVRELSVANLPERELRASLPFQVRDSLPLPVERSLLDFHPLEEPGRSETVRGLLIAAPKDAVVTVVSAIERAGLHVVSVDLASFALLRAVSRTDGQVEAIVDIGAQATSVVIHADGEPLIVRTIPRGGAEITEHVAGRLGVAVPEAESIKCHVGLRSDVDPGTAEVIREAVWPIVNEIRSSFAYLSTGDRQARVTRLALSGGGCLLPGLSETLATQLGVDVVPADPTIRLGGWRRSRKDAVEPSRSSAAVSIGLALGAA
ncbi:type IV pilus assembly protein PilM [Planosporangium mesophilum]|uniref:Pilus assembly protein PilM n=1 Tax=Planosporangium mesophilum TaxID=689768 RepID=A0A8J3X252_9ACTN|nr:type IV pilus assembly protein PilM [Planosporangium mesophilum]NJC85602.1 type IV pilus assembly protein PilM [Planosporangium mesophilum]GII24531.1 pilus assembly protein PilM [Planosporangium mesophilum]